MSYALVMWGEQGTRPNHKVEDLDESKGFVRLPATDGSYKVTVIGLNSDGVRAYRKAKNNGDDPLDAALDHLNAEHKARDEAAAKEAENAKAIGSAVQGEREPAPAAPEPRDQPDIDPPPEKMGGDPAGQA